MSFPIPTTDVLAGLALLLSIYATWKTVQFNNRQKSVIESQELLNKRLLEKEDAETATAKKATLGVTFVKYGSSNYKLKVFNKGPAAAHNVRVEFPDGNECIIESELQEKFPLEALERHQSVELIAAVHMGTKPKHAVKLTWDDEFKMTNEKVVYATL